jgi:HlyD family secretion protein
VDRAQRQVVPQTAVLSDDKGTYVYIVNGSSIVERRDVKVGGSVPEGIVIASGLKGDERVVATAASFLRVGERVETTSATAKTS